MLLVVRILLLLVSATLFVVTEQLSDDTKFILGLVLLVIGIPLVVVLWLLRDSERG